MVHFGKIKGLRKYRRVRFMKSVIGMLLIVNLLSVFIYGVLKSGRPFDPEMAKTA